MPDHVGPMTAAQVTELAEALAEKAVAKVFRRLRIKIDDDDEIDAFVDNQRFILELREDQAFVENQRFLTELRAGRKKLGEAASGAAWDVTKKVIGYILLVALVAAGASIGIHFPVGTTPLPAVLPPASTVLGPRQ